MCTVPLFRNEIILVCIGLLDLSMYTVYPTNIAATGLSFSLTVNGGNPLNTGHMNHFPKPFV
jgi:hypothetical protein